MMNQPDSTKKLQDGSDPVEEYFDCVTECLPQDKDCEEQCVVELKKADDPQLDVCSF